MIAYYEKEKDSSYGIGNSSNQKYVNTLTKFLISEKSELSNNLNKHSLAFITGPDDKEISLLILKTLQELKSKKGENIIMDFYLDLSNYQNLSFPILLNKIEQSLIYRLDFHCKNKQIDLVKDLKKILLNTYFYENLDILFLDVVMNMVNDASISEISWEERKLLKKILIEEEPKKFKNFFEKRYEQVASILLGRDGNLELSFNNQNGK